MKQHNLKITFEVFKDVKTIVQSFEINKFNYYKDRSIFKNIIKKFIILRL